VDAILVAIAIIVLLLASLVYYLVRGRRLSPRLSPLEADSRRRYAEEWRVLETRFIDEPREAVAEADRLAMRILQERGADLDDRRRMPGNLQAARRLARGRGGDALLRAMQRYQAIVDDACGREVREAAEHGRLKLA
jgi:hypothetical protein